MFPRWDRTWLLGRPLCLPFTFLWRLGTCLQLDEGHIDCLKASSCTKPSLGIIQTWLKSLPGAGSARNFLLAFAEWSVVPFLTSSLCFRFGNSLMLPGLNTSLLFPCDMPLLQRLEEIFWWMLVWTLWTYCPYLCPYCGHCVLQDHLQPQEGGPGDSDGPFRDKVLRSCAGGFTVVPTACPFTC